MTKSSIHFVAIAQKSGQNVERNWSQLEGILMIEAAEVGRLITLIIVVLGGACLGVCAKLSTVITKRNELAIENARLKGLMASQEDYAKPKQLAKPND